MLEVFALLFEKLTQNGIPSILAISGIIIIVAIFLGIKYYRKDYLKLLFHKRNLCWFIVWLFSLSVMLGFCFFHVLSNCPVVLSLCLIVVYALFTFTVFCSVSRVLFLPRWYIKKYDKLRSRGFVVENKKVIEKRPWYFLDANERIEYELLKSRYLHQLGEIKSAYETISRAENMPMYDKEVLECDISRAYMLLELGEIKRAHQVLTAVKENDYPAYCFLESFRLEMEGKLDESFKKAQEAEVAININYRNIRVRQALYNHLGRLYCFRNNTTEVYRYYKLSIEEAKKLGEASIIDITYNNLIDQYLRNNQSETEIRRLISEYESQMDSDNLNSVCQMINLNVRVSQHYKKIAEEEKTIRLGYQTLRDKSKYPELAIQRVQILHMLQAGGFDLELVISDVEKDLTFYPKLALPQRPRVYIALAFFLSRPDVNPDCYKSIKRKVWNYLADNAINDLDQYYNRLTTDCVKERCDILASKVDVYVHLGVKKEEQFRLLNNIKQIYHDNKLLLHEAQSNLNIVKYYAQQCEKGYVLTEKDINNINKLLSEAIHLADDIPWPYLGNLIIDIACAYDFFGRIDVVCIMLNHFKELGLTEANCDNYRQHALFDLKLKYRV